MFFPIRCTFWLTIVFVTIFNQDRTERRDPVTDLSETFHGLIAKTIGHVETTLADHCTADPAACLRLVSKVAEPEPRQTSASGVTNVPLPPPRPLAQATPSRPPENRLSRKEERGRSIPSG